MAVCFTEGKAINTWTLSGNFSLLMIRIFQSSIEYVSGGNMFKEDTIINTLTYRLTCYIYLISISQGHIGVCQFLVAVCFTADKVVTLSSLVSVNAM